VLSSVNIFYVTHVKEKRKKNTEGIELKGWGKKLTILFLVGLLGVVLAGCSQKKDTSATKEVPTYTVATEAAYAPFEVRDSKGNFTGFDMDLIRAVANVENFKLNIKDMGFDGIIAAVQTGNVDMAISAISIDPDRSKQVDFSTPYYQSGLIIAVKSDNNDIKSFADLKGKKVTAQIGTTGYKYCVNHGLKPTVFDHVPDALMEVKNGGAVALVNDQPVSAYYVKKSNGEFKLVGSLLTSEYYGIAFSKSNTALKDKVDEGLQKLKANGTYAKLYQKWFGQQPPSFLPGEEK
jgi:glutamine transport system substrate-binding protein